MRVDWPPWQRLLPAKALVERVAAQRQRYSDHYDWLSGYLAARGLSTLVRAMMGLVTAGMTVSLLALLSSGNGPRTTPAVAMMVTAVVGGMVCSLVWLRRWPTYWQSLTYAMVANLSTALACLAYPRALPALVGCIAFATFGAYIAFFHSVHLVIYNFVVATLVAVVAAVRMAADGDAVLAVVDFWLVVQINVVMPVAIQVLVRALGGDLLSADRDPLTGLFNRRAFWGKALGLVMSRSTAENHMLVAVVDLDDFKSINDTYGHPVGDAVLMRAAGALRVGARRAIVARSGGEEFLVALVATPQESVTLAEGLCGAIAASSPAVKLTASVGTASASLSGVHDDRLRLLIDGLVTGADAAMYRAKREGGNRCRHQRYELGAVIPDATSQ